MTRSHSLALASLLKQRLREQGLPIQQVVLFGSHAKGKAHKGSDVDIAVVCEPFRKTRHEENLECLSTGHSIDLRIETICLHPTDFQNRYSTIVQEVKRYGIPV